MKLNIILLLCIFHTIDGRVEMIGPRRVFVDISETNIWIDPGVICRNGSKLAAAMSIETIDLTTSGRYTLEYNCYPEKATRIITVGPAVCYMLWNPVCCSSKTYSNDCEAYADACFILTSTTNCDQQACKVAVCGSGSIVVGQDKNGCGGFCLRSL